MKYRDQWRDVGDINDSDIPTLPIRANDLKRYPRSTFGFVFEESLGDRIDTFSGITRKDMVKGDDTTFAMLLSDADLDTIYRKAIEIRLFEYPEPHPLIEQSVNKGMWAHSGVITLTVRAGRHERKLQWNTGYSPGGKTIAEWKRLYQFVGLVRRVVERQPTWDNVKRRGWYM